MRVSGRSRSQLLLKELEIPSWLSLLHNSFLEPALGVLLHKQTSL
jgi:hypothetical protein